MKDSNKVSSIGLHFYLQLKLNNTYTNNEIIEESSNVYLSREDV